MGSRIGLDYKEKRTFLTQPGIRTLAQLVGLPVDGYAIPTPSVTVVQTNNCCLL